MINWFTHVDLYCERVSPSFWAEPLNAISNISFVIAGLLALYTAKKLNKLNVSIQILSVLVILIGIGSFLFHTFANVWASFADVVPIWTFVALFVFIAIMKKKGKPIRTGGLIMAMLAVAVGIIWITASGSATQTQASTDMFNGSMQYLPALIVVWGFAIVSWIKPTNFTKYAVSSAIVFSVSLVARTLDLYLCSSFPLGMHFIWHLCNGLMIGLLLQGLVRVESSV